MITRSFTFNGLYGKADFRIAYEAFRARDPQKCKDDRKILAELQRAFEAISDPVGELPDDADLDTRLRKLKTKGGGVSISQRAHEKLTTFVEEAPFQAGMSAQLEDFLDRWSTAEKRESDGAEPAAAPRPRPMREKVS